MSSNSTPAHDEQFCPTCGAVIKEQAQLCPECGADNDGTANGPSRFHYCESCGAQMESNPELCPQCGVRQRSAQSGLDGATVMLWVVGVLAILWGFLSMVPPDVNVPGGLFALVVGTLALPAVHQRLGDVERRHSLTTFGTVKSVEKYPVARYEGRCATCDGPVADGIRREYAEEFVLFGVVLSTEESGSNVYCENCAVLEERSATGRLHTDTVSPAQVDDPKTSVSHHSPESHSTDHTDQTSVDQTESRPVENAEE
jgi:RNA polymerase subunit RPABC4/transcription elongation factor Spt4